MCIEELKIKYNSLSVSVKAAIWFMISNVIQKGIVVLTTPIFTRLLTVEQYGQYTLYQSWLSIFTLICTFRLTYSVFNKGMSKFPDERNEYTSSVQTTMSVLTIITFFIYLLFHKVIDSFTELGFFITLAMFVEIFFSSSMQIWALRKRYNFEYKAIIIPTLTLAFVNPVVGIIAVCLNEEKGIARILSCITIQALFGVCFYIINIRNSSKLVKWEHCKFSLLFNFPLIPHYMSTYILAESDRVMIQKLCGYGEAAIYGIAYNVGTLVRIVTDALNHSIVPWVYHKLEKKEYKEIEKAIFPVFVFVVVMCLVFVSFAPEFVLILGGKEYSKAAYVIPPVAASMFFIFFFSVVSNIEFFFDANKFTMYISIIGAIMNIGLNYIAIPRFGFVSAGYTTLICYAFFGIAHYLYMNHIVKKKTGETLINPVKILILSAFLIISSVGMSFIYEYLIIRYCIIILIICFGIRKRELIKKILFTNLKR